MGFAIQQRPLEIFRLAKRLDWFLGRMVRLNHCLFSETSARARKQRNRLENRFLVASIERQTRRLICYGANIRLVVGAKDVVPI